MPFLPPMASMRERGAKKKKKKEKRNVLKFTLDSTHSVEDGIMDAANLEQFLQERIQVKGKAGHLGGRVETTGRSQSKITNNLHDRLCTVANSKESHELCYLQINQDEEEEEDEN
ncbi:unnamed protein product [Nyctereutes procyonoides]|uniref:Large ribosomal subunit protein eL22 n=1 Tax=Nyctereutes procyonoides TaxID=34880 RepID=A0A811XVU4_NYCPR|nr:unnamed protein product [Nyctereutes procyonoides]